MVVQVGQGGRVRQVERPQARDASVILRRGLSWRSGSSVCRELEMSSDAPDLPDPRDPRRGSIRPVA
jgi:hypothetical protein